MSLVSSGSSGASAVGLLEASASTRTLPPRAMPMISDTLAKKRSTLPAATSAIAGAPPR